MEEKIELEELTEKELLAEMLGVQPEDIGTGMGIVDVLRSPMGVCKEMDEKKRKRVLAAKEFARRLLEGPSHRWLTMKSASDLVQALMPRLRYKTQEVLIAVALDARWNVLAIREVAKGTYNEISIRNRDIFREMLKYPVQDVILVHNHPNGNPEPTDGDIGFTNNAIYSGAVLGLRVLDSIIIGDGEFVSLREKGCCIFKDVEKDVKDGKFGY